MARKCKPVILWVIDSASNDWLQIVLQSFHYTPIVNELGTGYDMVIVNTIKRDLRVWNNWIIVVSQ